MSQLYSSGGEPISSLPASVESSRQLSELDKLGGRRALGLEETGAASACSTPAPACLHTQDLPRGKLPALDGVTPSPALFLTWVPVSPTRQ